MLALRQDLTLLPVEPDRDGQPAWVLHDPAQHRFFRFGATEIDLLDAMARPDAPDAKALLKANASRAEAFMAYLRQMNLLQGVGDAERQRLLQSRKQQTPGWFTWASRSYLSLRLPVLRSDAFLDATVGYMRWWFDPRMKYVMLALGLLGLGLMLPRLDLFFATIAENFTPGGLLLYGLALALVKIVHEFGHAYTAKYHGCRVPVMGVAFIVFWPIFYTDTTDAWRLHSRAARVEIDIAGMKAEIAVAVLTLLAWSVLPEGPLAAVCFMISTTSLLLTFAVNLNPLMRFDGYYLLSDWLGIENLQERSTALARWRLREILFRLGDAPPEKPSDLLVIYALSAWAYRLLLTLSIAAFIYSFFFKLLGALLFAWQLWLYALKPMLKEVTLLAPLLPRLIRSGRAWLSFGIFAGGLLLLALPTDRSLSLPSYLRARDVVVIYAPLAGRVATLGAANGVQVAEGAPLLEIAAEDLTLEIEQAERNAAMLRWQLEVQSLAPPWMRRGGVIEADLQATMARLQSLRQQADRARLAAPFAGMVRDMLPDLAPGQWIGEGEALFTLTGAQAWEAVAFVTESDAERLKSGAEGRFVAGDGSRAALPVRVIAVDATALREFDQPYLLSLHGGPLQARSRPNGGAEPLRAYYRVRMTVLDPGAEAATAAAHVLTGHVVLNVEARSPVLLGFTHLLAAMRREASF